MSDTPPPRDANLLWPIELTNTGSNSKTNWDIAEECPVALRFGGSIFAVMLASPGDLADFALGFALSEGIIDAANEVQDVKVKALEGGIELDITIAGKRAARLDASERRRALAGGSGCGLCGIQGFEEFTTPLPSVADIAGGMRIAKDDILMAAKAFPAEQHLNQQNHSVHGAAFVEASGKIAFVREDVGRHNALDKLIGAVLAAGIAPASGFLFLSSRAGYELIHKAARTGFPMMVTISAPTAMAIRAADDAGLTLASLAGDGLALFTHSHRIV